MVNSLWKGTATSNYSFTYQLFPGNNSITKNYRGVKILPNICIFLNIWNFGAFVKDIVLVGENQVNLSQYRVLKTIIQHNTASYNYRDICMQRTRWQFGDYLSTVQGRHVALLFLRHFLLLLMRITFYYTLSDVL